MRSDKVTLYERRANTTQVDSVEEVLNLRGSLRGRMALGGADPGFSPLACASVLPGQNPYLGCGNRPAGHGKEKARVSRLMRLLRARLPAPLGFARGWGVPGNLRKCGR